MKIANFGFREDFQYTALIEKSFAYTEEDFANGIYYVKDSTSGGYLYSSHWTPDNIAGLTSRPTTYGGTEVIESGTKIYYNNVVYDTVTNTTPLYTTYENTFLFGSIGNVFQFQIYAWFIYFDNSVYMVDFEATADHVHVTTTGEYLIYKSELAPGTVVKSYSAGGEDLVISAFLGEYYCAIRTAIQPIVIDGDMVARVEPNQLTVEYNTGEHRLNYADGSMKYYVSYGSDEIEVANVDYIDNEDSDAPIMWDFGSIVFNSDAATKREYVCYFGAGTYPNAPFTFNVTGDIPSPDVNGPYDEGNINPDAPGLGPGGVGGNGSFGKNEVSDPITVPNGSAAGDASATGMMTRYLANSSYLEIFGDWLWTTDLGLAIAKSVISLIYGDPAESVISVMSYPFDIRSLSGVTTRNQNLYWGNHNSGLPFIALTSSAATVDWGTISLSEYWKNFLDYEPHTKIELYLPWGTGFVPIDPGQCLPGTLKVITNIDLNKGSCIHNVFGNNNCVIGTYAGQCSQQIPITSNDYASKIAGVVTTAASLAVAGTSGAIASSVGAEEAYQYRQSHFFPMGDVKGMNDYLKDKAQTIAEAEAPFRSTQRKAGKLAAVSSIAASRITGGVSRNGSFTDGSAALGCQYPYIILSRPTQSVPDEYGSHYGYPSNRTAVLGELRGYTEVGEIHLNGIDATGPELSELNSILKGGVIF